MEIRKIKKEELLQSEKIAAVAFDFSTNLEVNQNDDNKTLDRVYGAFDDNSRLMGQMEVIPHQVYFDGNIVQATGIAGVSTLPEYRHMKAIRKIFESVFEDMRSKKQYISQLFPFSHAYYNKFGYEATYERMNLSFGFDNIKHIERNNKCTLVEDYNNEELRKCYEKYASWHNGSYNRNDELWEKTLSKNIYNKRHYPYIYYNESNQPAGHFIYTRNGDEFKIIEIGCEAKDELVGILGFIRNFEGNYKRICVSNLPLNEDFSLLLTNHYDVERKYSFDAMTRIADAKKIFELMKYPPNIKGSFSIAVNDEFLPYNTGVYNISYKDGKASDIERKGVDINNINADIEVSATALAKLVFGTDDLFSHRYKFIQGIKINGNTDVLKKVFVKKHIFVGDFF